MAEIAMPLAFVTVFEETIPFHLATAGEQMPDTEVTTGLAQA